MKWAFSSAGLVAAGLVGVVIVILFQTITINNEEDYYLLKETAEAAMFDSIDLAYYRDTGEVKIVKEKFVENFTRRFAESIRGMSITDYSLEFYSIYEKPPKASIIINTGLGKYKVYGQVNDYNVSNKLDAILEADDEKLDNEYYNNCKIEKSKHYYMFIDPSKSGLFTDQTITLPMPGEGYRVATVDFLRGISTIADVEEFVNNGGTINQGCKSLYNLAYDIDAAFDHNNYTYDYNRLTATFKFNGSYKCNSSHYSSLCCYGIVYDITWKTEACFHRKGG